MFFVTHMFDIGVGMMSGTMTTTQSTALASLSVAATQSTPAAPLNISESVNITTVSSVVSTVTAAATSTVSQSNHCCCGNFGLSWSRFDSRCGKINIILCWANTACCPGVRFSICS